VRSYSEEVDYQEQQARLAAANRCRPTTVAVSTDEEDVVPVKRPPVPEESWLLKMRFAMVCRAATEGHGVHVG